MDDAAVLVTGMTAILRDRRRARVIADKATPCAPPAEVGLPASGPRHRWPRSLASGRTVILMGDYWVTIQLLWRRVFREECVDFIFGPLEVHHCALRTAQGF